MIEEQKEKILKYLLSRMELPSNKYHHPFIIAMHGHCGSGKSTTAQMFSHELGAYIIGGDKIRDIMFASQEYSHDRDTVEEVTSYVYRKEVEYLLSKNIPVIVDRSISSTKDLEELKSFQVPFYLIRLISNDEENLKRITRIPRSGEKRYIDVIGDYDSISPICTIESYQMVKKNKVYDIEEKEFTYSINTLYGIDHVETKVKEIAEYIRNENLYQI